jgi:EmrB/QacA subfamily drug resistance transporter
VRLKRGRAGAKLGPAIAVIAAVELAVTFTSTSINVGLPAIQKSFGLAYDSLQWIVIAYTLPFGSLLLFGGRLGDIFGRRRLFVTGLILFTLASGVSAVSVTAAMLMACRAVQGVGAALAAPSALALIASIYAEGELRNRAIAVYSAMASAGAAVGFVIGGALTALSWRYALLINLPIGLIALIGCRRYVPETAKHPSRMDIPGALTATASFVALAYGFGEAPSVGWGNPNTYISVAVGAALLAVFCCVELWTPHGLVPGRLFTSRARRGAYITVALVVAAQGTNFYIVGVFVQRALHYSPLEAGLIYLPSSVANTLLPTVWAKVMGRVGGRPLIVAGSLLLALGCGGMSFLNPHMHYLTHIFPFLLLTAAGTGLTFLPLTLTAVSGVEDRDVGLSSGLLTTIQTLSGALGLAVLISFAGSITTGKIGHGVGASQALADGFRTTLHICVVIALLAAVSAMTLIPRTPVKAADQELADVVSSELAG